MLPSKRRSNIVIDGETFHWTRGRSPENLWVTVQHASGKGPLLRIDLDGIPLPADVADAIRFAMANGWEARAAGSAFFLGFTTRADHPRFVVRNHDSPDYWREFS